MSGDRSTREALQQLGQAIINSQLLVNDIAYAALQAWCESRQVDEAKALRVLLELRQLAIAEVAFIDAQTQARHAVLKAQFVPRAPLPVTDESIAALQAFGQQLDDEMASRGIHRPTA